MTTPVLSIAGTPAAQPLGYFSWTSGQLGRDPYYILVVIYIFSVHSLRQLTKHHYL